MNTDTRSESQQTLRLPPAVPTSIQAHQFLFQLGLPPIFFKSIFTAAHLKTIPNKEAVLELVCVGWCRHQTVSASSSPDLSRSAAIVTTTPSCLDSQRCLHRSRLGRHGASCFTTCRCDLDQKPLCSASSLLGCELLKPNSIHRSLEEAGMCAHITANWGSGNRGHTGHV